MSLTFQMIEEGNDQIWRNVGQCYCVRRLAQARFGKPEEEHEAIAIGGDGLCAECPLLGLGTRQSTLGRVRQMRVVTLCAYSSLPPAISAKRSNFPPAKAINSGTAVRYQ